MDKYIEFNTTTKRTNRTPKQELHIVMLITTIFFFCFSAVACGGLNYLTLIVGTLFIGLFLLIINANKYDLSDHVYANTDIPGWCVYFEPTKELYTTMPSQMEYDVYLDDRNSFLRSKKIGHWKWGYAVMQDETATGRLFAKVMDKVIEIAKDHDMTLDDTITKFTIDKFSVRATVQTSVHDIYNIVGEYKPSDIHDGVAPTEHTIYVSL